MSFISSISGTKKAKVVVESWVNSVSILLQGHTVAIWNFLFMATVSYFVFQWATIVQSVVDNLLILLSHAVHYARKMSNLVPNNACYFCLFKKSISLSKTVWLILIKLHLLFKEERCESGFILWSSVGCTTWHGKQRRISVRGALLKLLTSISYSCRGVGLSGSQDRGCWLDPDRHSLVNSKASLLLIFGISC